jgi:excisionase family DNA binding protein
VGKLLTTTEAATRLGVSATRVQVFISEGRLPAQKVGHFYAIDEDDLKLIKIQKRGRPKSKQTQEKPATAKKRKGSPE